jgi:hypothetical protein
MFTPGLRRIGVGAHPGDSMEMRGCSRRWFSGRTATWGRRRNDLAGDEIGLGDRGLRAVSAADDERSVLPLQQFSDDVAVRSVGHTPPE